VQDNGLRQLEKIFLIEVIRNHQVIAPVSPQQRLYADDAWRGYKSTLSAGIDDSDW